MSQGTPQYDPNQTEQNQFGQQQSGPNQYGQNQYSQAPQYPRNPQGFPQPPQPPYPANRPPFTNQPPFPPNPLNYGPPQPQPPFPGPLQFAPGRPTPANPFAPVAPSQLNQPHPTPANPFGQSSATDGLPPFSQPSQDAPGLVFGSPSEAPTQVLDAVSDLTVPVAESSREPASVTNPEASGEVQSHPATPVPEPTFPEPKFITWDIPVSTTPEIIGRDIVGVLGPVLGVETRTLLAVTGLEATMQLTLARQNAIKNMVKMATDGHADAVVALVLSQGNVGTDLMEFTATGTAVQLAGADTAGNEAEAPSEADAESEA